MPSSFVSRIRVAVGVVCLCLLQASSSFAGEVDLVALFPWTESSWQGGAKLGTPQGDAMLGDGWQPAESGVAGAYAVARRSTLRLQGSVDSELRLSCSVPGLSEGMERRVAVMLNGHRVGIATFPSTLTTVRFPLRATAVRDGDNLVELKTTAAAGSFAEEALLCREISFSSPARDARPQPELQGTPSAPELFLPELASATFFVRLAKRTFLTVDVCAGRVEVRGRAEAGGNFLRIVDAGSHAVELSLSELKGEFAAIEFRALGDGARVCAATVESPGEESLANTLTEERTERAQHVILIVIDSLRADRLGVYGGRRGVSPNIDALAHDGVVFERARAQSAWTTPATASILTGTEPTTHGARKLGVALRPDVPALAHELRTGGFTTAAITTNVNTRGELGFARGFKSFRYLPEDDSLPGRYVASDVVVDEALKFLDQHEGDPVFLYLHLSEPHAPYAPGEEFAARFALGAPSARIAAAADPVDLLSGDPSARNDADLKWLSSLYDAEVATVDVAVGKLVDGLRARGMLDSALLVLTSDHGESFGEHGEVGHGRSLFAEELDIPLVIRGRGFGIPGRREKFLARQIDLLPTILDSLGLPVPASVEGVSLLRDSSQEMFAETKLHRPEQVGFLVGSRKVIRQSGRSRGTKFAVYDRNTDPREERNIASDNPYLVGWAEQEFRRRDREARGAHEIPVDAETRSRLQMLGYVD